jgi:hypothetical protein
MDVTPQLARSTTRHRIGYRANGQGDDQFEAQRVRKSVAASRMLQTDCTGLPAEKLYRLPVAGHFTNIGDR